MSGCPISMMENLFTVNLGRTKCVRRQRRNHASGSECKVSCYKIPFCSQSIFEAGIVWNPFDMNFLSQNHRMFEVESSLWMSCPTPLAQAGTPRVTRPGPCPEGFWTSVSKEGDSTTFWGNLVVPSHTHS